jgi:DNA-binding IclR family transcriptional regulator
MDSGSKTIERIQPILRALENGSEEGMTAADIASVTGFDKATAYRALVSLARIGLLDRDAQTRKFRLGIYLFNLGAIVARRFSVLAHARQAVAQIARETGDTVFLSVRNKYDSVCVDCATGAYPIKAQTLTVGESVPLGVSAGGVAMLATMPDEEVRHAIQFNAVEISKFRRVRPEQVYEHVQLARDVGYAHYAGHVGAGMGAVARAIRNSSGTGVAVISVTALLDRLSDQRVRFIDDLLKTAVDEIEQRAMLLGNRLETLA